MEQQEERLEVNGEYRLATFYCFKLGPHDSIYLGREELGGAERDFFRKKGDSRTYFVLADTKYFPNGNDHTTKPFVTSGLESDFGEAVFGISETGEYEDLQWDDFDDQEKSRLIEIMKKFGEIK